MHNFSLETKYAIYLSEGLKVAIHCSTILFYTNSIIMSIRLHLRYQILAITHHILKYDLSFSEYGQRHYSTNCAGHSL